MLLLALLLAVAAPPMQRPTDIVKWSAAAPVEAVRRGDTVKVSLTASIENGWKLYALTQPEGAAQALSIEVGKDAPFSILRREIAAPKWKAYADAALGLNLRYYDNAATLIVPVRVAPTATAGKQQIPLRVTFQACTDSICLLPFTSTVKAAVTVTR